MLTGPDDSNRIDRACVLLAVVVSLHCLVTRGSRRGCPSSPVGPRTVSVPHCSR